MPETKEYQCDKCKCKYHLETPNTFCVCGGKLICVETVKETIDAIFEGFKGAKNG